MFCPKCGSESLEGQRFCKACGTNLQLINDAIRTGDSPAGPFGLDIDGLTRNAKEFAESWKKSWSGHNGPKVIGLKINQSRVDSIRAARRERRKAREEARRQNLPKPKEYISYSWQHNLRNGLLSLFWGTGLGVILYYLGQTIIDAGLIKQLEDKPNVQVHGLDLLVRMMWMIAALPVLKGLAQIIYAAFFAESMATLTTRFTPQAALPEPAHVLQQDTAPRGERTTGPTFESSLANPPSVTEHTTQFFEEEQRRANRESQ